MEMILDSDPPLKKPKAGRDSSQGGGVGEPVEKKWSKTVLCAGELPVVKVLPSVWGKGSSVSLAVRSVAGENCWTAGTQDLVCSWRASAGAFRL